MSGHEKKQRSLRLHNKPPSSSSIIATPPRAALHSRSKAEHDQQAAAAAATAQHHTSPNDHASTSPSLPSASTNTTVSPSQTSQHEASAIRTTSTSPNSKQSRSHPAQSSSSHISSHHTPSSSNSAKDKKIAELEIDLATMEDEFERELTQLSHKLTNESETATFWQQKHSALNQTFLKTDTDLRLLRQEVSNFQQAREERDRDIKTRISSLMLDRDALREAYNEAMSEVRGKEEEVRKLQGQVRGLKSWVSSSSKMDEQVTDEAFGERMQRLGNGLQNWVITNFRRVKIDATKANEKERERLTQLIPTYEALATTSKIHLVQTLVSRLLVDHIFQVYFVGLPRERGKELADVETYLGGFGSAESMNQWRSTTLAILRKEADEVLRTQTESIVEEIVAHVNNVMHSISDLQPAEARDQSLRTLINSSIELSRLMRVQKAVFQIIMPSIEEHQRTMFDAQCMEDIGGEDEDTLNEREIQCVTFPGIVKSGDENGEKIHLRNVIAKIRVLCAPD